jgi:hypothetical protein
MRGREEERRRHQQHHEHRDQIEIQTRSKETTREGHACAGTGHQQRTGPCTHTACARMPSQPNRLFHIPIRPSIASLPPSLPPSLSPFSLSPFLPFSLCPLSPPTDIDVRMRHWSHRHSIVVTFQLSNTCKARGGTTTTDTHTHTQTHTHTHTHTHTRVCISKDR